MGLNTFPIFMSSCKGLGRKKQFWPIRMKISKPFRSQRFHYTENLLYEFLSTDIHRINCPTPVGCTKIRLLMCCVISLAQYIIIILTFSSIQAIEVAMFNEHLIILIHLQLKINHIYVLFFSSVDFSIPYTVMSWR